MIQRFLKKKKKKQVLDGTLLYDSIHNFWVKSGILIKTWNEAHFLKKTDCDMV